VVKPPSFVMILYNNNIIIKGRITMLNKKSYKLVAGAVTLSMCLSISSTVFVKAAAKKTMTLTMFDKNTGDAFDNTIAKEITKVTGVKLAIQQPTGNPAEKLNLMLASGDYPDMLLMDRSGDAVKKYTAAGALVPLNDLIKKYGPDIKKMYGNILNKTRSDDGKNYYLSNWYGLDNDPVFGVEMRLDLLKAMGKTDLAKGGKYLTTAQFEQLLKDFVKKYPKINGKKTTPIVLNGSDNLSGVLGTFKGMYGLKSYYEEKGNLKYDVKDPKYLEMLKYANKLYREGLIDQEWVVTKTAMYDQKLSDGNVFATLDSYWDQNNANAILKKGTKGSVNVDRQFYAFKVVAPGVSPSKTTYGSRNPLGWDAIAITKKCKDPVAAIKFINYLASEKGQTLLMWGIKGQHYDIKNGKKVPRAAVLEGFAKDWNGYVKKTGIRKWTYFIKNGLSSDGTPYDVTKYKKDEVTAMASKNLLDSVWDCSEFDGLGPDGGTPEALIAQKITDITNTGVYKIIVAPTEVKAAALYKDMIKDINAAGASKIEKIITDNYKKRMKLWK
jgi:putative aldouronate transport system substrate-binding protein